MKRTVPIVLASCYALGTLIGLVSIWSWFQHDDVWRITGAVGASLLLVANAPGGFARLLRGRGAE